MIKNIILLISFVMTFALSGQAQTVKFMPMAGLNYATFSESFDEFNFKGRTGWQAGFEVKIGQKFYVSPGLFYYDSKSKLEKIGPIDLEPTDVSVAYRSLQIPLLIGGDLFASESFGMRAETGAAISFFLDDAENLKANNILLTDSAWSLLLGLAVDVDIFTFGIRQQFGLTNILSFEDTTDTRLHLFQFNVGIRL